MGGSWGDSRNRFGEAQLDRFYRASGTARLRLALRSCLIAAASACAITPNAALATPSLLEQSALTQQGLAIGLAQTMIQTELDIGRGQSAAVGTCLSLSQGGNGSQKTLVRTNGGDNFTVEIYYDNACTKLYVHAVVVAGGPNPNVVRFTETLTYHGTSGIKVGTASVVQRVGDSSKGPNFTQISNVGTLTPVNGGLPVHFGFECAYPNSVLAKSAVDCSVGVAQEINMLSEGVASLATITGTLTKIAGLQYKETFSGSKGRLARGQNLGISAPTMETIKITGTPVTVGSSSTQGSIGRVSAFMGAPASWTVTDTAHNAKFSITLHATASPFFAGTISLANFGATVATIRTDVAGNGSVTFSNNQKIKISNWMLVN
jgi:hypothetical protein